MEEGRRREAKKGGRDERRKERGRKEGQRGRRMEEGKKEERREGRKEGRMEEQKNGGSHCRLPTYVPGAPGIEPVVSQHMSRALLGSNPRSLGHGSVNQCHRILNLNFCRRIFCRRIFRRRNYLH